MINEVIGEQTLKAVCDVLGDTYSGYTKTELTRLLEQSHIQVWPDRDPDNRCKDQIPLNKRDWLYNCLANDINIKHSMERVFIFLEKALNPVAFTGESKRSKYQFLLEGVNKALLMDGLEINREGKLLEVIRAKTLDEVDRRVNSLKRELYNRKIHAEVQKYCIEDYLRKDYYDAIFEASKGLAERVRQISGLTTDGANLFETAFSTNDPYILFNSLKTPNEKNEFIGVKELLEAIFHLVRNPAAHTPKVNWKTDETKALDILTLISFAHKYLDECHKMPGKS